jgi:8-oxo-dGTP diphosphatase
MKYPGIGTAIWVRKNGKLLMGLRSNKTGKGTWCPPGGRVEMYETIEDCAIRETREEAAIEISDLQLMTSIENIWPEMETHFVTFYYVADWKSGEPIADPAEFTEWGWFDWKALPSPLFRPSQLLVDSGINPLEFKG